MCFSTYNPRSDITVKICLFCSGMICGGNRVLAVLAQLPWIRPGCACFFLFLRCTLFLGEDLKKAAESCMAFCSPCWLQVQHTADLSARRSSSLRISANKHPCAALRRNKEGNCMCDLRLAGPPVKCADTGYFLQTFKRSVYFLFWKKKKKTDKLALEKN